MVTFVSAADNVLKNIWSGIIDIGYHLTDNIPDLLHILLAAISLLVQYGLIEILKLMGYNYYVCEQ